MDAVLDKMYGKVGTAEREQFRSEARAFYIGKIIRDARHEGNMSQSQLADKIGINKTYISKIENGSVEPGIGLFFRIIDALGLKFEIVKPVV